MIPQVADQPLANNDDESNDDDSNDEDSDNEDVDDDNPYFQVLVRGLDGRTFTIDNVRRRTAVATLLNRIFARTGYDDHIDNIYLTFNGHVLQWLDSLDDWGINAGDTIQLNVRGRGGAKHATGSGY